MIGFFKRMQEAVKILLGTGIVLEAHKAIFGRAPPITFKTMMDCYGKDPVFRDSVDLICAQIVGPGFHTTCASPEEYRQALKAKEIVDQFNKDNNLDALLQVVAKELVITGSSIVEKITPKRLERLQHLPIYTFDKVITNEFGRFEETEWTRKNHVEMGYQQLHKYGGKLLKPEQIIHFCWNPIDDSGWGCGLMRTILATYTWQEENKATGQIETYTRRSLMDMKASIDEQMAQIIDKFAGPLEIYAADTRKVAEDLAMQLKTCPKRGARIITSGKIDAVTAPIEPRARFSDYLNYLFNLVCLAGQTPMPRLFVTPGFTEASATVAKEIGDLIIMPIQRMIKREIEAVWTQVIEQAGLNPAKANVRLNWGMEKKPEVKLADLIKLAEISATTGVQYIRPEELRKNLVKFGFELWEKETPTT